MVRRGSRVQISSTAPFLFVELELMAERIENLEINPFVNPLHSSERIIGDGEGRPWPNEYSPVGANEAIPVRKILLRYMREGGNQQALEVLQPGETFDNQQYANGTVFLTMAESLIKLSNQRSVPMIDFLDYPLPERPGLTDVSRELHGHGYIYTAQLWLNLVVAGRARPYLIKAEDAFGKSPNEVRGVEVRRGLQTYEVGEVSHFVSAQRETLKRVNEHVLCMHGVKARP